METNRKKVKKQVDVEKIYNKIILLLLILTIDTFVVYGTYRIITEFEITDFTENKLAPLFFLGIICHTIMGITAVKITYQFLKRDL